MNIIIISNKHKSEQYVKNEYSHNKKDLWTVKVHAGAHRLTRNIILTNTCRPIVQVI